MTKEDRISPRTERLQQLLELAATQAGYFTAAQARALGYSPRSLVHHAGAGHFERVSQGFYRMAGLPADVNDDVVAAWLKWASRDAVVSHDTALALYDLAPGRSPEIHLTVPRGRRPRRRQSRSVIQVHTTTVPLRRDEVVRRFGVKVTAPARTLADVAEIGADPSVVVEAAGRALATGLVTPSELRAAAKGRSARVQQLVKRALDEAGSRA
jgi:predicted transcriptional regulator of viral defense system